MFKRVVASAAFAGALVLASAVPTHASTWPVGDTFVIGDAKWQMGALGILYGWDSGDVYQNSGYLSYPTSMYSYDYLYCGNGGGYYSDPTADFPESIVRQESNGDISVECPLWTEAWDHYPGLSMQSFARFYHEEHGGYLARFMTTFVNSTGADITVDDLYLFGSQIEPRNFDNAGGDFITSSGANALANGDTWSAAGNPSPTTPTVYLSSGWAKTGNGAGLTVTNGDMFFYEPLDTVIPANSSKSFITYTFMVIPATQDTAGTDAAWAAAKAQAVEYATFGDRLTCGIPEGTVVEFWGTAPADTCASPSLPNTGVTSGAAFGALVVLALGALLTRVGIRHRRHSMST